MHLFIRLKTVSISLTQTTSDFKVQCTLKNHWKSKPEVGNSRVLTHGGAQWVRKLVIVLYASMKFW